jgi:hypothetical protein
MGRVNSSTDNKIERGIGNTSDQILGYASINRRKGKGTMMLTVQLLKELVECTGVIMDLQIRLMIIS